MQNGSIQGVGGIVISPYESFALALFGVFEMEPLVAFAEKRGLPFQMVRDRMYESKRAGEVLVPMARALLSATTWPDAPPGAFIGARASFV